jgi:hypothetical protein
MLSLLQISYCLKMRLISLFAIDQRTGMRPCHGSDGKLFATDPHWRNLVLFHEYFHADSGTGLGGSHQTGWTSLVANLLLFVGKVRERSPDAVCECHKIEQNQSQQD